MPPSKPRTLFAEAMDLLAPGQSLAQQARLFDGATRLQIYHWRKGTKPPQWALTQLAKLFERGAEIARQIEPSDKGYQDNLSRWHQKNRAEKSALSSKRDSADV